MSITITVPDLPPGYELRGATEAEIPAITVINEGIFHQPREFFVARYRNYPGARAEHSRIVLYDGRPVSHIRLYQHPLSFCGATVNAWAIGDVCTLPEFRHKGLGSALLQDCARYTRAQGSPLLMVHAGRWGFYENFGWDSVLLPALKLDVNAFPLEALPDEGYLTRSFGEPGDLWQVAAVHSQYIRGRSLIRQRDLYYWNNQHIWDEVGTNLGFILVEKRGQVVAYARMWRDGDIVESAYLPDEERAALVSFQRLIRQARLLKYPAVSGQLPADHPIWRATQSLPGVERTDDDQVMLRVLDLHGLFSAILPALSDHLRASRTPLSGPVSFRCLGDEATLMPRQGYLELGGPCADSRVVDLTQAELVAILAGTVAPSKALAGKGDASLLAELDALFPASNAVYFVADFV
jgi:predicted N-acetyltransferase YhbS